MKTKILTATIVIFLFSLSLPVFADFKFCSMKERILEDREESKRCQKQFWKDRKLNKERTHFKREEHKKKMQRKKDGVIDYEKPQD